MRNDSKIKGEWEALTEKIQRTELKDRIEEKILAMRPAAARLRVIHCVIQQMDADAMGLGINGQVFTKLDTIPTRHLSPKR